MLRAKITGYLAKPLRSRDADRLARARDRKPRKTERTACSLAKPKSQAPNPKRQEIPNRLGFGIWDLGLGFLLLFYPIALLLKHRDEALRPDEVRRADDDEAGRSAFQARLELRHPVAVALGDE